MKNVFNNYLVTLHLPVPLSRLHEQSLKRNLCERGTPTLDGNPAFMFPPHPCTDKALCFLFPPIGIIIYVNKKIYLIPKLITPWNIS